MLSAMYPTHDTVAIDERRARQLRGILHARRAPILPETRGFVFVAPFTQRAIGEETPKVVLLQAHRLVRAFFRVGDAAFRVPEARAKLAREFGRPDDHEAHGNPPIRELRFDLAQLRERLTEERSTDVAQPNDEGG